MLVVVLGLSAILTSSLVIGGIMVSYQLRQAAFAGHSTAAIYAADAGIEYELYRKYKDPSYPAPVFRNGAEVRTSVSEASIRSVGIFKNAARAFEYAF